MTVCLRAGWQNAMSEHCNSSIRSRGSLFAAAPEKYRFYTRDAASVRWDNTTSLYTSEDLDGSYEDVCEYLSQCGQSTGATCDGDDRWGSPIEQTGLRRFDQALKLRSFEGQCGQTVCTDGQTVHSRKM